MKAVGGLLALSALPLAVLALALTLAGSKERREVMSAKGRSEWAAFDERAMGSAEGTGRKTVVRVREVIYVLGDGKGSVLCLRGEVEPLGVVESVETVMERLQP